MPCAVTSDATTDAHVDVRLSGTVTPVEFDELALALGSCLQEWSRVLYDATELDNAGQVLAMLLKAPCRESQPRGIRQAAVVAPAAAAAARSWVRLASPQSSGTQAFPTRAAALDWLLGEYQTTTGGS